MLEFKNFNADELISWSYYYYNSDHHATLAQLKEWSDEVEMNMYYSGGFIYFKNEKDKTMFILRWM